MESLRQIDNASGKPIKEVRAVLHQTVKYHGTYTPPKPKARKGKKKLKLKSKRKDPTAIKKTKVRKVSRLIISS